MEYFNLFGTAFLLVILIPNIVYAIANRNKVRQKTRHRILEPIETVGRIGCMAFMAVNIPGTFFGWWSDESFAIYLCVDLALALAYCALWIVFWKKETLAKALFLSILPSLLFLFSGAMSRSLLLLISALIFAPAHIAISCKDLPQKGQNAQ